MPRANRLDRIKSDSAAAADPTPAEIAQACREIRLGWKPETEKTRKIRYRIDNAHPCLSAQIKFLQFLAEHADAETTMN